MPYILQGAGVTLVVVLFALPVGLAIGLGLALLRVFADPWLARLASAYSVVIRGLPPVVLIFLLYYVIAGSINLPPLLAGTFSLALVTSAYQSEIFRGALLSVGVGQEIAARSLGMSRRQAAFVIVLPQALRLALPSWSNEVAIVIKQSSLVYALGVTELLRRAHLVAASSFKPFFAYGTAALFYLAMTFSASRVLAAVERKVRIPVN